MSATFTSMPKGFARQLLAYEVASGKPADAKDSAAFRVCEKLRVPLGKRPRIASTESGFERARSFICASQREVVFG